MAKPETRIEIFLATPDDVIAERTIVFEEVTAWNEVPCSRSTSASATARAYIEARSAEFVLSADSAPSDLSQSARVNWNWNCETGWRVTIARAVAKGAPTFACE